MAVFFFRGSDPSPSLPFFFHGPFNQPCRFFPPTPQAHPFPSIAPFSPSLLCETPAPPDFQRFRHVSALDTSSGLTPPKTPNKPPCFTSFLPRFLERFVQQTATPFFEIFLHPGPRLIDGTAFAQFFFVLAMIACMLLITSPFSSPGSTQ